MRQRTTPATRPRARCSPPAEPMSAFARFSSHVQLGTAFGALLFPGSLPRLFLLGLCFFGGSQSQRPGLVRLLHGTLWVNAPARVRRFATNRTKISNGRRYDLDWLDIAHVAPGGEVRGSHRIERTDSFYHANTSSGAANRIFARKSPNNAPFPPTESAKGGVRTAVVFRHAFPIDGHVSIAGRSP